MKKNFPREAFTLVELLIVLLIIGILAGALLLTIANTQAKAEATKIVSDLRALKSAMVLYYADTGRWFPVESTNDNQKTNYLSKYLEGDPLRKTILNPKPGEAAYFAFYNSRQFGSYKKGDICIGRYVYDDFAANSTRLKLAEMQPVYGFLNGNGKPYGRSGGKISINLSGKPYGNDNQVALLVAHSE
jgi:prepilin-type N-terminal cleavage/methylation domain-containing protein